MKSELKQKQKLSMTLVYGATAAVSVFVILGGLLLFNVGNIRMSLAASKIVWEGTYNADWKNAKNWVGGKVPDGDIVIIAANYKYAPVIKGKSPKEIYSLTISKASSLTVQSNFSVAGDVAIKDEKSVLNVGDGELTIGDDLFVQNEASLSQTDGNVTIGGDMEIAGGQYVQSGKNELKTKGNLFLNGKGSYFTLRSGSTAIDGDLILQPSDNSEKTEVNIGSGSFTVKGQTIFNKESADEKGNSIINISGGNVVFNEFSRKTASSKSPLGYYRLNVSGGKVYFKENLIMDDGVSARSGGEGKDKKSKKEKEKEENEEDKICSDTDEWEKDKEYSRKKGGEQVYVKYDKKLIYRMKDDQWWSKGDQPSSSSKMWELYQDCDKDAVSWCSKADSWSNEKTYERKKGGQEVYVTWKGKLYKMKEDCWWSANHPPHKEANKTYWTFVKTCEDFEEATCGSVSLWESDMEYRRSAASDVIEVFHDGVIYQLLSSVWYSKNNTPASSSSYWKKTGSCDEYSATSSGSDKFVHTGGLICFSKKWIRPDGFESQNDGIVQLLDQTNSYSINANDKFKNLMIDADVQLELLGDVSVRGNLTNNSTKAPSGNFKIVMDGSDNQYITGEYPLSLAKMRISNTTDTIYIEQHLSISTTLILDDGVIVKSLELAGNKVSNPAVITIGDNATLEYGDGAFIDGPVAKIGDDAFVFPVGKAGKAAYISMSAPTSSSTFQAEYFNTSPENVEVGAGLLRVSVLEYWEFVREAGTGDVSITLFWNNGASSMISDPSALLLAGFDGSQWQTLGNGGFTGDASNGTITNSIQPTEYQNFTFGSNSSANALPVELMSFEGVKAPAGAQLNWATASEKNNAYFSVERSVDGLEFKSIAQVKGYGNSSFENEYSYLDNATPSSRVYYRLRQVDFDGKFAFSKIVVIPDNGGTDQTDVTIVQSNVYPNPFSTELKVNYITSGSGEIVISISSLSGQKYYENHQFSVDGENTRTINNLSGLPIGLYILNIKSGSKTVSHKIQKF